MFAKLFIFCSLFFLAGCGSSPSSSQNYEIAIDPSWAPLNFQDRQNNVLGFATELLTEVSNQGKISISLLNTNWDSLLEGLKAQKYQGVLTSLYPYNFNQDLYSFSEPFLLLGPVLIVPMQSSDSSLENMSEKAVGAVLGSSEVLVLEKDPTILIHTYDTIPDVLNDLVAGNIQAALLPSLTASAYVNHLYFRKLKIASKPLTEEALRLITLKGKSPQLIEKFNKAIDHMKKNGDYEKLLSKWDLSS
jgi:polar amino acid transport system substrate-binding protein